MAKSRGNLRAAETARHTGEQRRLGEHEAGRVDQKNLCDQIRANPNKRAGLKSDARRAPRDHPKSRFASRPRELRRANHAPSKMRPPAITAGATFGPMRA